MKKFFSLLLIIFLVQGCSALAKDDLTWFQTLNEAVDHGIKEEGLKEKDILGEVKEDGETFIFYKKYVEDGLGIGIASISEKNGQFAWYKSNPDTLVKNDAKEDYSSEINWDTKTQSEKSFTVYAGTINEQDITIETAKGEVTPEIDKDTGIYYYIESK